MASIALHNMAEPPLTELLLDSLRRMAAAGHQPGRYIVLRLTDGRVRAYALSEDNSSPSEMIAQIRNESGPLSSAFVVGSKNFQQGLLLFVEDLLVPRRLEQIADGGHFRYRGNGISDLAPGQPKDLSLLF